MGSDEKKPRSGEYWRSPFRRKSQEVAASFTSYSEQPVVETTGLLFESALNRPVPSHPDWFYSCKESLEVLQSRMKNLDDMLNSRARMLNERDNVRMAIAALQKLIEENGRG